MKKSFAYTTHTAYYAVITIVDTQSKTVNVVDSIYVQRPRCNVFYCNNEVIQEKIQNTRRHLKFFMMARQPYCTICLAFNISAGTFLI